MFNVWELNDGAVTYHPECVPEVGYITVDTLPTFPQEEWVINWTTQTIERDEVKRVEAKISSIQTSVQDMLDSKAQEKGYDTIISACSYTGYPNPFKVESELYTEWRGNVWATCYQILGEWENGIIPEPSEEEVLAQLPELAIPS